MAPAAQDIVDDSLKDVIQDLYEIQSSIHGYLGPETHQELIRKIHDLTGSLQSLTITSQNLNIQIPPEIVEYLEEGRNPDIYTREFVELVQKGNQYLKGKSEAFGSFRDILAEDIIKAWPEMEKNVRGIVRGQSRNADVKMENGDGNRGLEGKVRSNGIAEEKK